MDRYSVIREKNPREIVLLRGSGCVYRKCTFCDYYSDSSECVEDNFELNKAVLYKVTGEFGNLEIINSGSVFELDGQTMDYIMKICMDKKIEVVHFEAHYLYEGKIPELRKRFEGIDLKMKLGLETFDYDFRENILKKGIREKNAARIAENFDEANFLFGIKGQSVETMKNDIEEGLRYFERICINLMCENTTDIKPDKGVTESFMRELYPVYKDDNRIDILINNTDFGVGD